MTVAELIAKLQEHPPEMEVQTCLRWCGRCSRLGARLAVAPMARPRDGSSTARLR